MKKTIKKSSKSTSVVAKKKIIYRKLVDKQDRNKLGEGRDYGMGFAFCKKTGDREFETVQPISPCKDYLNEPVYTEATGKASSAYGLSYSKQGIFEDQPFGYLAIKILPHHGGSTYNELEKHKENLKNNYLNIKILLRAFEEIFKIEERTRIYKTSDAETYLLYVPLKWTKGTYLISLYTLLVRIGQFYDGIQDPKEFVKSFSAFNPDTYLAKQAYEKVTKYFGKELPEQKMEGMGCPHNIGIIGYNLQ